MHQSVWPPLALSIQFKWKLPIFLMKIRLTQNKTNKLQPRFGRGGRPVNINMREAADERKKSSSLHKAIQWSHPWAQASRWEPGRRNGGTTGSEDDWDLDSCHWRREKPKIKEKIIIKMVIIFMKMRLYTLKKCTTLRRNDMINWKKSHKDHRAWQKM